jgi:hypothetical protein
MKSKPGLYLSGSIEYSKNYKGWRNKMFKNLHSLYKVIIPEKANCPFDKTDPEFKAWIKENTVLRDMINVSTSQFFFVKIDKAVLKGAGTISEITTASWLGKNMLVLLDGLKEEQLPTWMLGCLANADFVNSIDEAIVVYRKMAQDRGKV